MNEGSIMKKVHPTALQNLKTMHSRFHIWSKLVVQAARLNYCKTNLTPVKKKKKDLYQKSSRKFEIQCLWRNNF
jgi:hypothetical protein